MTLRVAHLNLARGYRGGERQAELLVRALKSHPVEQVVVARRGEELAQRLADAGVEIREVDGLPGAFSALADVDVSHSHEGRGVYAAWLRSRVSGTPYIITRRVNNPLKTGFVTRNAYIRASAVAGVAGEIADIVKRYDERINTTTIHSSSSGLPVDKAFVDQLRARYPGKFLVGNVGALSNGQKGQEYIIAVARELEQSHPDIHFMLVGGGEDEAMLKDMAAGLGNLSFEGFVNNVGDYLAAFDLFILPSNKEGIGGILLDAMDQSLAVIAARVGGLHEIVHDGENGLMIEPRRPDQLRDAILDLKNDAGRRRHMGEVGRKFSAGFSADVMAGKYLALYCTAVSDAR